MTNLGKMFLGLGFVFTLVGAVLWLAGRYGLSLGRLPGDITFKGKNVSVFLPLGTSIMISLVLSAILYLMSHFRR